MPEKEIVCRLYLMGALYKQSQTNPKKSSERKSCACVDEIVAGEENAYARGMMYYVYKVKSLLGRLVWQ